MSARFAAAFTTVVWVNARTEERTRELGEAQSWDDDGDTIYVDTDGRLSVGEYALKEKAPFEEAGSSEPARVDEVVEIKHEPAVEIKDGSTVEVKDDPENASTPPPPMAFTWPSFVLPESIHVTLAKYAKIICDACATMKNTAYDQFTGELLSTFCPRCRRAIACADEKNRCPLKIPGRCQTWCWVDEFGAIGDTCRGCVRSHIVPRLPSYVSGPTRTVFEANLAILCNHCVVLENFRFDKNGWLVRVFCESCQIRIAEQPLNACEGEEGICARIRWVDPLGGLAPMCGACWKHEQALQRREAHGRTRQLEKKRTPVPKVHIAPAPKAVVHAVVAPEKPLPVSGSGAKLHEHTMGDAMKVIVRRRGRVRR